MLRLLTELKLAIYWYWFMRFQGSSESLERYGKSFQNCGQLRDYNGFRNDFFISRNDVHFVQYIIKDEALWKKDVDCLVCLSFPDSIIRNKICAIIKKTLQL